jgi:hypothetical protein
LGAVFSLAYSGVVSQLAPSMFCLSPQKKNRIPNLDPIWPRPFILPSVSLRVLRNHIDHGCMQCQLSRQEIGGAPSRNWELMDMQPRKMPMAAIEERQRAFEGVPECRVEEVTKVQAIRMLVPQIHAMQSKGYNLRAIAGMLSEHGIAVTSVTLKSYLNQVKVRRGKKASGQRKSRQEVHVVGIEASPGHPRSAVPTSDGRTARPRGRSAEQPRAPRRWCVRWWPRWRRPPMREVAKGGRAIGARRPASLGVRAEGGFRRHLSTHGERGGRRCSRGVDREAAH